MRVAAGPIFVSLALLPFLMAPWARADDEPRTAATVTAEPKSAAGPSDEAVRSADKQAVATPLAPAESHRRRFLKKGRLSDVRSSSQQAPQVAPIAVTELPWERLQQLCSGDAAPEPMILVPSTLAEAMRRVALWGDSCPFCGHVHASKDAAEAQQLPSPESKVTKGKLLTSEPADDTASEKPTAQPLVAGEPAQVILDTQKRIGKSVLEGTEFSGSPELLIQWIRVLDEENRRRQAALDENTRAEITVVSDEDESVTPRSQVGALREACRDLQQVADLLEEQNLFDSADSIRSFAEVLRRQSRQKLSQSEPAADETAPDDCRSEPRHANSKR